MFKQNTILIYARHHQVKVGFPEGKELEYFPLTLFLGYPQVENINTVNSNDTKWNHRSQPNQNVQRSQNFIRKISYIMTKL